MRDGKPTVELDRPDVAMLLERAAKIGLTVREYEGQMSLQMKYGKPPEDLVTMLRQNKAAVLEAVRLHQRLEIGWSKVEMELDPEARKSKEDFWLALLADYEAAAGRIVG